ncbi:hypothetical protein AGABI1DRAFT_69321 [Agaricus bisporus var. burnettii JB137-S8]|uniref:Uncharacterized protein n=1 Tax=Agaricus bisporus var. burnettii (strain JB137-S8 / ATCC MYA-4627 / FGSC 10392) TaxID=597362 RepID=K5XIK4_AGABU|nr:uncharacterized protein AGABI1DRAFT_69321 [Agaricus bisporus var. burnettii JB137-S8]EKM83127.1 hypothetical protein AGABI1DRAFT_69321 [Agaricus bisporus var. burnettii JB137-S8]
MDSENTSTPAHGIQYTGLAHSSSEVNPNLKETPPASIFTEKVLPLHANITHSPPNLLEDGESERVDDPGHIGTLTLVPCTFADGSLGWKGRRKVNVELLNIQPGEKAPVVDVALLWDLRLLHW